MNTTINPVAESWKRIDTWLQAFSPARAAELRPGVTSEELAQAETELGLPLPVDFKESYRIHNGAEGYGYLLMGYPDFFPLSNVVSSSEGYRGLLQDAEWAAMVPYWVKNQQHLPVQPVWRHPAWLDFAGNGAGDTWCIDLAPPADGLYGQVIAWGHEVSVDEVLFKSFGELLSTYADQLEAGLHLGFSPLIDLRALTRVQDRRVAFQSPSPATPVLQQAMERVWEATRDMEERMELFQQVLQMENVRPEDRFQAYYSLITMCEDEWGYSDYVPPFFAQLEAEASRMPATHWVHEEVLLLKPWSIRR